MATDRFVNALVAQSMYEEEVAKRLGINPHSEYGRNRLNRYMEEQRKSDELSAQIHLQRANPGKFISLYEIRSEANKIRNKRLAPYVEKAKMLHKLKEPQVASINETKIEVITQKDQEMYREEKTDMDKQKKMKFVLFHPVSICIKGKDFKYGIKDNLSYPILLGFITEDNKCVEVISGREFDIISDEQYNRGYAKITDNTQVVSSPVYIYKKIDSSLENLKFIEKYITAKGHVSQREIEKHNDFAHRLNRLLSYSNEFYSREKNWNFSQSLFIFESPNHYLNKIDYTNSTSLAELSYIQSGKKASDDLTEKNDIILRLTKKLSLSRNQGN